MPSTESVEDCVNRASFFLRLCVLLPFLVFWLWTPLARAAPPPLTTTSPSQFACLTCHDFVDESTFRASVHSAVDCSGCHPDAAQKPNHAAGQERLTRVSCESCHEKSARDTAKSVHVEDLSFGCVDCHGDPHTFRAATDRRKSVIRLCTGCHESDTYLRWGHDAAAQRGNADAAVCTDCHGAHLVRKHSVEQARDQNTLLCVGCHGDAKKMARSGLAANAAQTYGRTYHGQVQRLGYTTRVAGCADCHAPHNILRAANPKSALHPDNLVQRCRSCHPFATPRFAMFCAHPEPLNRSKNPILFFTLVIMTTLLTLNLLIFEAHTALWWGKSLRDKVWKRSAQDRMEAKEIDPDLPCFIHFRVAPRVMHMVLLVSFFGLVITGIPLLFSYAPWAQTLMALLGGPEVAGHIHRGMALLQFALFIAGLILAIRFLVRREKGCSIRNRLFGKDSLIFRKQDWLDLKAMIGWFIGRGPKPSFDRWTYWEKADVFAFFWGMFTIGLSGLILWFPEAFAPYLPGWIYNVAILVHSFEAMLATVVIFTAHFTNTHLLPGKFPIDLTIFSGRIRLATLLAEKPRYFRRLAQSGELRALTVRQPHPVADLLFGIFGFLSVGLGLLLIGLIVIGLVCV